MTIAYLTPEYPHPRIGNSGGLGTSIKNLAEALVGLGHRVCIIVSGRTTDFSFDEHGIRFYGIAHQRTPFFTWYTYRRYLNRRINALVETEQIDLIEAPDWTGLTAFMRFKVPLVIRFNGSDTYFCHLEQRPQKWKNRWFERLALRGADALVSVSAFTAQTTKALFNLQQQIAVVPNGIKSAEFLPQSQAEQPHRLLYFGSIIRKKGVLELAIMFNILVELQPDVALVLAGKDVPDALTHQSTQALFLDLLSPEARTRVQFLGMLPYEAVQQEIAQAAVVVLPSFAEALPMAWIEAMAMQKAVVASNIGWASEVISHEQDGMLVDPKAHRPFAEVVVRLLQQPELRKQLGLAARQKVLTHFDSAVVAQKNLEWYKTIITKLS
ncbi:MAG: glycosyltransferase family 4 protein [Flavobacteriaceae bacterium]|nr:glycosyltransferase family 4 protein [Flavobacteriaceae bacterium]